MLHPVRETPASAAIIGIQEANRRAALLEALKDALSAQGVTSVLVSRFRLILRSEGGAAPSGRTDPQLHIFAAGRRVATTDGRSYRFGQGGSCPTRDLDHAVRLATRA